MNSPDFEPAPDVWGFRHGSDGTAYMTREELEVLMATMPELTPADMAATLDTVMTLTNPAIATDTRLAALRRLRATGLVNDAQAQVIIGAIFEGR